MEPGTKSKKETDQRHLNYPSEKILGEKQNFDLLEGRQRLKDRVGFQIPKLFFVSY